MRILAKSRKNSKALPKISNNYKSDYGNLIKKNGTSMEIKRLQTLATEIFKTINNIDPSYIRNIFNPKTNENIRPHDIIVRYHNIAS